MTTTQIRTHLHPGFVRNSRWILLGGLLLSLLGLGLSASDKVPAGIWITLLALTLTFCGSLLLLRFFQAGQVIIISAEGITVENPRVWRKNFYHYGDIRVMQAAHSRIVRGNEDQQITVHVYHGQAFMLDAARYANYYEVATALLHYRKLWLEAAKAVADVESEQQEEIPVLESLTNFAASLRILMQFFTGILGLGILGYVGYVMGLTNLTFWLVVFPILPLSLYLLWYPMQQLTLRLRITPEGVEVHRFPGLHKVTIPYHALLRIEGARQGSRSREIVIRTRGYGTLIFPFAQFHNTQRLLNAMQHYRRDLLH